MLTPQPTAAEIKAMRETQRLSLHQAKSIAYNAWWLTNLNRIKVDASTGAGTKPFTMIVDTLFTLIVDLVTLLETINAGDLR